jgi:hypothetical protein
MLDFIGGAQLSWGVVLLMVWSVVTYGEVYVVLRRTANMRVRNCAISAFGLAAGVAVVGVWILHTEKAHEAPKAFPSAVERWADRRTLTYQILPSFVMFGASFASFVFQVRKHAAVDLVGRPADVRRHTYKVLCYFPASTLCSLLAVLAPGYTGAWQAIQTSFDCWLIYVYCSLILEHMYVPVGCARCVVCHRRPATRTLPPTPPSLLSLGPSLALSD